MLDNPALVMRRLSEIEQDLAHRQNDLEEAAEKLARVKREWEFSWATVYLTTTGTIKDREATTLIALTAAQPTLYDQRTDAEAAYDAQSRVVKVLSDRASIGMAILKAQSREWTPRAA